MTIPTTSSSRNQQQQQNVESQSPPTSSSSSSSVRRCDPNTSDNSRETTSETTDSTPQQQQQRTGPVPQLEIPLTSEFHPPPPVLPNQNSNGGSSSSISSSSSNDEISHIDIMQYNQTYYNNNTTSFGAILRGDDRARILDETIHLLAFVDQSPQSPTLHALIIPKRFIATIHELQPPQKYHNSNCLNNTSNIDTDDVSLVYEMEELGHRLAQRYSCSDNHRMVFHVPPFNTVDHLHLHVLCNHDLSIFGRTVKYVYDTPWCISMQTLLRQMTAKQSPPPPPLPNRNNA